ncbi:MAG: hypothetical protein HC888_07340 [Candidatus Competibacteraceae bacterium]|nr:hypothetical protein [Candidatus Competibacteraceae bacterium]
METLTLPLTLKKLTEIEVEKDGIKNTYWFDKYALNLLGEKLIELARTERENREEALCKKLDYPL